MTLAFILLITIGSIIVSGLVLLGGGSLSTPVLIAIFVWVFLGTVIVIKLPKPGGYPADHPPSQWDRLPWR